MDNAVKMAPAVGIVALCAALGLSRATFYRHQGLAAVAQAPSLVAAETALDELGGRSPVAVCGRGTEGATAPPTAPVLAANGGAARRSTLLSPLLAGCVRAARR